MVLIRSAKKKEKKKEKEVRITWQQKEKLYNSDKNSDNYNTINNNNIITIVDKMFIE